MMYHPNDATTGGTTYKRVIGIDNTGTMASDFARAMSDPADTMANLVHAFDDFPPLPIPLDRVVCLDIVLPTRRGLVLKQQEDKRREQLKVWGLRR